MIPPFLRLLLFFFALFLIDWYIFSAIRFIFSSKHFRIIAAWVYWTLNLSFFALTTYLFFTFSKSVSPSSSLIKIVIGSFILLYVPKLVLVLFLGIEDIYRLFRAGIIGIFKATGTGGDAISSLAYFESRRQFISQLAGFVALIPAIGILYGMTRGKYNFKIHRTTLTFHDLPDAFHGTTITQISDLHIGSFDDKEEVKHAVKLINKQQSDLLFFTGDMVNNQAQEMEGWIEIFQTLHAPLGKYSILGNHDYGDYVEWPSAKAKEENMHQLFDIHKRLDFTLLRNENTRIEKNGQYVELLGMENWGKGFARYGDLEKTAKGTTNDSFKILLSHDPSHWEEQVMNKQEKIHLTLSGHTHGMQFGIEIPGVKISPAQLKYKRWGGLYEENNRYLYVNRGLGFLGFPGRVGIWPEITVITLQKA